jgi:TonB family protein
MHRRLWLMLCFGTLACSVATQGAPAQTTAPNLSKTGGALTKLAQPSYPSLARQARIQGDVEIALRLRKDGSVESAEVASGQAILAMAALESAKESKYECLNCGEEVTSYSLLYTFRLRGLDPTQAIGVTQAMNHITIIGGAPTTESDACITTLSSFAVDPSAAKPPELPDELRDVSVEYTASGCYGRCPAFTLRIDKNKAAWDGHAFVKKKGKSEKKISDREFSEIVRAWLDAKMYAMRDDYCQPTCPDGTSTIITDVQETSVSLKAPSYSKTVLECFTTIDGKPQNPRPPQGYFEFSRRLVEFVKSNHWL